MPQTTVATLIERAKSTADMRDNFVKPNEWLTWATQERVALDLYIARSGWPQKMAEFPITVTGSENGAYGVNPKPGVMAIITVYQYDSSGRVRQLENQEFTTFLRRDPSYSGSPSGHSRYFHVSWATDNLTLNLYPQPSTGETYKVIYLPHPKRLVLTVGDADLEEASVAYPLGWEERIVLGMARRALIKEESSTGAVDSEIGLWDARIEEACWSRVISQVPSVRNSDPTHYSWSDRYLVPPFGLWVWV